MKKKQIDINEVEDLREANISLSQNVECSLKAIDKSVKKLHLDYNSFIEKDSLLKLKYKHFITWAHLMNRIKSET